MRIATRIYLAIGVTAAVAIAAAFVALRVARAWKLPDAAMYAIAISITIPAVFWSAHVLVSRITELHAVLGNALSAFRDGDFGLRLAVRGDRELAELKALYNEIADAVRA